MTWYIEQKINRVNKSPNTCAFIIKLSKVNKWSWNITQFISSKFIVLIEVVFFSNFLIRNFIISTNFGITKKISLKIYEINSIGTNNNAKPIEVFEGINKDNIWNLWCWIQIKFIPINIEKDNVNVIIIWLVVVKLYGINPIKLLNKIKINITEIKGKYFSPFLLILSNNNWEETSYNISNNTCHVLGIKYKLLFLNWLISELIKKIIKLKKNKTKKFTNTKLVIEKSKQNNLIENNKIIWNCSKGINNIIFNLLYIKG